MGEWAVDWDSKRCEVFGNVEDMSDDERKKDGMFGYSRPNYTEVREARLISATKGNPTLLTLFRCLDTLPLSVWKNA